MNIKTNAVRVRFAPSPTGYLHIGGLRTALFNWFFARHNNGVFLVRIEDTDIERSKPEYVDAIMAALAWMNIASDEPIILQSDRFAEHKVLIDELLMQGKAYKDYYSQDEFTSLYKQKIGDDEFPKAYRICRDQPQQQDKPYVVRFKLPFDRASQQICFDDVIRGTVCVSMDQLDDFVIARSDERPMYNFVVVADDMYQGVTHIIRGEDHISNTPKQLLLYEAFGKQAPIFAHLPLILGKDGQRLSKRYAATSTEEYRDRGYLPDALLNYLVRLGWAHGDQELFSRGELIDVFSLDQVGKKGAMFDQEKLNWLNALYMRQTDNQKLFDMISGLRPHFDKGLFDKEQLLVLIGLYKERCTTLVELAEQIDAFMYSPTVYDKVSCEKWVTSDTREMLLDIIDDLHAVSLFTIDNTKMVVTEYAHKHNKKLGMIAQPLRIALTGGSSSPGIFELLAVLGKQESEARLKRFVEFLQSLS